MAIELEDSVRERLTAYIAPNTPDTPAKEEAFDNAGDTFVVDYVRVFEEVK